MVVAIAMVHHKFGFFMNWTGAQKGEGFEYRLLVLALYDLPDDSRSRSCLHRSHALSADKAGNSRKTCLMAAT